MGIYSTASYKSTGSPELGLTIMFCLGEWREDEGRQVCTRCGAKGPYGVRKQWTRKCGPTAPLAAVEEKAGPPSSPPDLRPRMFAYVRERCTAEALPDDTLRAMIQACVDCPIVAMCLARQPNRGVCLEYWRGKLIATVSTSGRNGVCEPWLDIIKEK